MAIRKAAAVSKAGKASKASAKVAKPSPKAGKVAKPSPKASAKAGKVAKPSPKAGKVAKPGPKVSRAVEASTETTGKVGIIATIAEVLKASSKANPVDREDILAVLKKAFPARPVEKMAATIGAQVPGRIAREQRFSESGLRIMADRGSYWVEKIGKKASR
jgi:hypothetical protein